MDFLWSDNPGGKNLRFWFAGLMVVLIAFLVWQARSVILLILTSIVFAIFIESTAQYLIRMRIPRAVAIILVFIIGIGIFGGIISASIPVLIKEISALKPLLPDGDAIQRIIQALPGTNGGTETKLLSIDSGIAFDKVSGSLSPVWQGVVRVVGGAFGGFVNLVLLAMLSIYLALEERAIERLIRSVVPVQREAYILSLWFRLRSKIESWFRGQLFMALVVAVGCYVGLVLLKLPYALLLSLLAGVLGLIPFGIVAATVPAIGIAIAHGGALTPVYVVAWYGALQYLTDYILSPLVVKRVTGLPPLLVIMSFVISVSIAGFLGFFLAIPAAVLLLEIVGDIETHKISLLSGPTDPVMEPVLIDDHTT